VLLKSCSVVSSVCPAVNLKVSAPAWAVARGSGAIRRARAFPTRGRRSPRSSDRLSMSVMDFLLDFGYCGFDVVTAKSDVFLLEVDQRSPADGRADLGPVKDC